MIKSSFVCDDNKNEENQRKHHVSFEEAQLAFLDKNRRIAKDLEHSNNKNVTIVLGKLEMVFSLYDLQIEIIK